MVLKTTFNVLELLICTVVFYGDPIVLDRLDVDHQSTSSGSPPAASHSPPLVHELLEHGLRHHRIHVLQRAAVLSTAAWAARLPLTRLGPKKVHSPIHLDHRTRVFLKAQRYHHKVIGALLSCLPMPSPPLTPESSRSLKSSPKMSKAQQGLLKVHGLVQGTVGLVTHVRGC